MSSKNEMADGHSRPLPAENVIQSPLPLDTTQTVKGETLVPSRPRAPIGLVGVLPIDTDSTPVPTRGRPIAAPGQHEPVIRDSGRPVATSVFPSAFHKREPASQPADEVLHQPAQKPVREPDAAGSRLADWITSGRTTTIAKPAENQTTHAKGLPTVSEYGEKERAESISDAKPEKQEGVRAVNVEKKERNIHLAQRASFRFMARSLHQDILATLQTDAQKDTTTEDKTVEIPAGSRSFGMKKNEKTGKFELKVATETDKEIRVAPLVESVAMQELEQLGLSDKVKIITARKDGLEPDKENPQNNVVTGYHWIRRVMGETEARALDDQLETVVRQTERAREDLIDENLGWAFKLAREYVGDDDMVLKMVIAKGGLIKAANTYDWTSDYAFSSYAHTLITNEMIHKTYGVKRARKDETDFITAPESIRGVVDIVKYAMSELSKFDLPITENDVVLIANNALEEMGSPKRINVDTVVEVHQFLLSHMRVIRLDAAVSDHSEGDTTIGDLTSHGRDQIVEADARIDVERALETLAPEIRTIVTARDLNGMTRDEVARALNIHPAMVTRLRSRGIKEMQKALMPDSAKQPAPVDKARQHFRDLVVRHRIDIQRIIDTMGVDQETVTQFLSGENTIDLNWLILATEQHVEPEAVKEDADLQALRKLRSEVEEPQWMRIFSDPSLSSGNAQELLRVSQLDSIQDAAKKSGVRDDLLSVYELDRIGVQPANLNKIIEASTLNPKGKPAQLLRQKNANMKIWHAADLKTASLGNLFNYAFVSLGAERSIVAKQLFMNPKTIDRFRKGKPGVIRKDLIPELFKAIGINEGSALGDVMNLKLENPNAEISQEILQQVVEEGQVVFYEHLPNDADYILSKPEKDIYKAVEKESTVGDRLRVLREALGIEKPDYRVTGESYGNFEIAEATINAIERGRNVPETHTAARIIKQYTGWSPFYPIARLILDAARSHRFE